MQACFVFISALSLVGIALDRNRALQVRARPGASSVRALVIIACIDMAAFAMALPYSVNMKV